MFVFESAEDRTDDEQPNPPIDAAEATFVDAERRRIRELGRLAKTLRHAEDDSKLAGCAELVGNLLSDKFSPIVWCRYIATADYLAEGLQKKLARAIRNYGL